MTNDLQGKILDAFVDTLAEKLIKSEAFISTVATQLSGKLARTVVLDDETRVEVKKEIEKIIDDRLEDKIDDALSGRSVEADDVDGLDKAIEEAVENITIDADSVNGLDEAIGSYMSENSSDVRVDASNVDDLDDAILEVIGNNRDIQEELKKAVLSGLTITVDAKIDGKSIEGVNVNPAH